MFRNYFLINLVLILIIGMLSFRLYRAWVKPLDIPLQGTQLQTQKNKKNIAGEKPDERQGFIFNEAKYNIIVQKDLFKPLRSAPQTEDIPLQFFSNPPKLYGTIITNNEKSAILEDPTTKTTRLYRLNDSFAGFNVSDIQENKVVLTRGDKSIEVKLREIKTIIMPRQQPFMPQPVPQPIPQPIPQQPPQVQQMPQVQQFPQPQVHQQAPQRPGGLPERPIRIPPAMQRGVIPPPPPAASPSPPVPSPDKEGTPPASEQPQGEDQGN